jgi:hypothetical protein
MYLSLTVSAVWPALMFLRHTVPRLGHQSSCIVGNPAISGSQTTIHSNVHAAALTAMYSRFRIGAIVSVERGDPVECVERAEVGYFVYDHDHAHVVQISRRESIDSKASVGIMRNGVRGSRGILRGRMES